MLTNPSAKYTAFPPIDLPNRTWPNQVLTAAPTWLSTDLRDGNQALVEPMDIARKLRLFRTLIDIGFKEIEIGFPSASQTEFDFTRHLIEQNLIPDDVTIQVLTPARESLIHRTFEALRGVKQAIVHVYNATAPTFRQVVFRLDQPGTIRLATTAATLIKNLAAQNPATQWRFQYSPEVFTATELPFAKEICNAVLEIWQPTPAAKAIINLPASVEVSTPNIFADQVEWMHRNLHYREAVVLCVHPHNDRGCSVAAAELGQMAGAERVEGCLFGNGERTGNVDLVTLAMNLYTQGISPNLDFSQIDDIIKVTEDCTQLPIHPRHPYAGELVFTAFSGSHQDAIKKGFSQRKAENTTHLGSASTIWDVPYLPMDPSDVGRSYESIVRVNSQSGKGGIAFLIERDYGLSLPRKLQIEFSSVVQQNIDTTGKEITTQAIWEVFCQQYQKTETPFTYLSHQSSQLHHPGKASPTHHQTKVVTHLSYRDTPVTIAETGNGPINAFINALNKEQVWNHLQPIQIGHYEERALPPEPTSKLSNSSGEKAIALIEIITEQGSSFGIGIDSNIVSASFKAITSALNRLSQQAATTPDHQTHLIDIGNSIVLT